MKKLESLVRGGAPVEPAVPPASEPANNIGGFSLEGATPDDAWGTATAIRPALDRHSADKGPSGEVPVSLDADSPTLTLANAALDDESRATDKPPVEAEQEQPVLSTAEQFKAYFETGQLAQAEEWLGTLVKAKPDDAEARVFLGKVLEDKNDGAGAALQYARALELLVAQLGGTDVESLRDLYEKVKQLAPASPIVAKLASTFMSRNQG